MSKLSIVEYQYTTRADNAMQVMVALEPALVRQNIDTSAVAASVTDWEIMAAQDWHVKKEVDEDGKETVVGGVYKKVPISIMDYLMDAEGKPVDKVVDMHTYSGADQFVWDVPPLVKADVEVENIVK